jgi:hypothetical protein
MSTSRDEIVRFYDSTFVEQSLQDTLAAAATLSDFQQAIIIEAERRGFAFNRSDLDATFDGMGDRDTFAHVDFSSRWISTIMRFGWVPKGYSR